jgi:hypothetical protein
MKKKVLGRKMITVISPIDTLCEGPKVPIRGKGWQPVHLRQGSMDGACGLYSLMMGLIICGAVTYEKVCAFYPFLSDPKIKRLMEYFEEFGLLVKRGIDIDQMFTAIDEYCSGKVDYQGLISKGSDLIEFIDEELIKNRPVLLLIEFEDTAHWVLVVGREFERRGEETALCRFLILDPSEDTPKICSWNGVLSTRKKRREYPYTYDTLTCCNNVKMVYAIAIWPKK